MKQKTLEMFLEEMANVAIEDESLLAHYKQPDLFDVMMARCPPSHGPIKK